LKENYKIIFFSVAQYLSIGFILLYGALAMHEMLHLKLLGVLGGDGYIVSRGFVSETVATIMPSNGYIVASSGIIVSLLYSLIAYICYRRNFVELYASLLPTISLQLGYGIFETIMWQTPTSEFLVYALPVGLVSVLIGFFISIYILYKSLKTKI